MRWDRLFDDLEGQLTAGDREEFDAEVTERTRIEIAQIGLLDRLRQAVGSSIGLTVQGGGTIGGVVRRAGPGWLLLELPTQPEVVINAAAILAVRGLASAAVEPAGAVTSRVGLGQVLRVIARDRSPVAVVLRDGSQVGGTIDRVGADFIDVAEHAAGEPRRDVASGRTVAFGGIAVVRPG